MKPQACDSKCKVMVVDDDKSILEVLSIILKTNGLQVEGISEGGEVYDNVFVMHPNVILLDVNLGEHDGRDICKELKSNEETKDINVIMFSANHNIRQSAMESKANAFLEKPFDIEQLIEKVKDFCPEKE